MAEILTTDSKGTDALQLERLSRRLNGLYALVLETERQFHPGIGGMALLDRLLKDPEWAWLRPLSRLIADIDHVLSQRDAITKHEHAVAATHIRGLVFNAGEFIDEGFLARYRPLLQLNPALASAHGELKGLLNDSPYEPEDEAERLHSRHVWAIRREQSRGM